MKKERQYDLQDRLVAYAVELIAILFTSVETAKKSKERKRLQPWILDIPCWLLDIQKGERTKKWF